MHNYMNDKLPISFQGMFFPLTEPNRTKSLKLENGKSTAFYGVPKNLELFCTRY